jgi:hypothetical protein
VEVNAGDDLDGDYCRDHEVDRATERRPPLRVGHELSAVLPEVLRAMTGEADDKHQGVPVIAAAAMMMNPLATPVSTAMTFQRPSPPAARPM